MGFSHLLWIWRQRLRMWSSEATHIACNTKALRSQRRLFSGARLRWNYCSAAIVTVQSNERWIQRNKVSVLWSQSPNSPQSKLREREYWVSFWTQESMAASQEEYSFPLSPSSEKDGCFSACFWNNVQLSFSPFPLSKCIHNHCTFVTNILCYRCAAYLWKCALFHVNMAQHCSHHIPSVPYSFFFSLRSNISNSPTDKSLTVLYPKRNPNKSLRITRFNLRCQINYARYLHRSLVEWSAGSSLQEARSQWGSGGRLLGTASPQRWKAATEQWQRWQWRGGTGPTRCSGYSYLKTQRPEKSETVLN